MDFNIASPRSIRGFTATVEISEKINLDGTAKFSMS
jgi:hypothetical protein